MKRKWLGRSAVLAALVLLIVGVTAGAAFAADPKPVFDGKLIPAPSDVGVSLNLLWVIISAVLVIFMQAGFALVETGFTRAKHAAHTMSMNFAIFGLGFVAFFIVGYAFMFGGYTAGGVIPFGYDRAVGDHLIGSGNWVFLWHGGFFLTNLPSLALTAPIAVPAIQFGRTPHFSSAA